jgi:endoglucanase
MERRDRCRYPYTDPETSYVDDDNAYASNEVAIDWNAAMVYLVNAMEAMQYGLGYSTQNNTSTTRK